MTDIVKSTFISIETTSFSGATLLGFLLNAHPQITTIGEMNGLISSENADTYRCSCGELIKTCPFWLDVTDEMVRRGQPFDVIHFDLAFAWGGPAFWCRLRTGDFRNGTLNHWRDTIFDHLPPERAKMTRLVKRNQAFVESVLAVSNKSVLVDTSKDRLRVRGLRQFSTLDVRIIHLVRDVRGVAASWLRRGRNDLSAAARQWVKWHTWIEQNFAALPADKYLFLRYEDLVSKVPEMLQQIYTFCGVDNTIEIYDYRAVDHHIIGNPMRLAQTSEIRIDERWKSILTTTQLAEINQIAGELNRNYGYH